MKNSDVDGGRAWIVLVACTCNMVVAYGVALNCGVYTAAMIEYYGSSRSAGYVVGALKYGLVFITGPVSSLLVSKTSHRTVAILGAVVTSTGLVLAANMPSLHLQYLTFGAITAIGCGLLYQPSIIVISHYFDKYRFIAVSVTMTGGGIGTLLYPLLCQLIINIYTWQPSLYIIAAIALQTCVGSSLIRPVMEDQHLGTTSASDAEKGNGESKVFSHTKSANRSLNMALTVEKSKDTTTELPLLERNKEDTTKSEKQNWDISGELNHTNQIFIEHEILEKPRLLPLNFKSGKMAFILLCINAFLWSGPASIPFVLAADIYQKSGISVSRQSILFLFFGVSNIIGRILTGIIGGLGLVTASRGYFVCNLAWGLSLIFFRFVSSYSCLIMGNLLFGLFYGAFSTLLSLTCAEQFGLRNLNWSFGIYLAISGVAGVIVPPIYGLFYDVTLNYTMSISVATIMVVLSAGVFFFPAWIWKTKTGR